MKRSEINGLIDEARSFCTSMNFHLPAWAPWSPDEWSRVGTEADEIRSRSLGWDLTDFGGGDFEKLGLLLFTIRNGATPGTDTDASHPAHGKSYCEKLLLVNQGQVTPMHFHWSKMEDIINRGGGILIMKLYGSTKDEQLSDEKVRVSVDGIVREFPAGTELELKPGESVTLPPYVYHSFWAKPGCGRVLSGEVSAVNDDTTDNRFLDAPGRFPDIEEDEPARYCLCNEYPPSA